MFQPKLEAVSALILAVINIANFRIFRSACGKGKAVSQLGTQNRRLTALRDRRTARGDMKAYNWMAVLALAVAAGMTACGEEELEGSDKEGSGGTKSSGGSAGSSAAGEGGEAGGGAGGAG